MSYLIDFLKNFILISILFMMQFVSAEAATNPLEIIQELPVAYQGRFRPLESAARLWLYDFYHRQQISNEDLEKFHTQENSALDLLWKMHFQGHKHWDDSPLFWIHHAELKSLLKLNQKSDRFSFNQLHHAIYEDRDSNLSIMQPLIVSEFLRTYRSPSNRSLNKKLELTNLSPGLWVALKDQQLIILTTPKNPPWNYLSSNMVLNFDDGDEKKHKVITDEILQLLHLLNTYLEYNGPNSTEEIAFTNSLSQLQALGITPKEIAQQLENRYPLKIRLEQSGSTLKMLPTKTSNGEWVSLHALKLKTYDIATHKLVLINNFTPFPDELFERIRNTYLMLQNEIFPDGFFRGIENSTTLSMFKNDMEEAYASITGTTYKESSNKTLSYPSFTRLKVENYYYKYPFIEITIGLYALSLLFIATCKSKLKKYCLAILLMAFLIHTLILISRCFILQRPPVSNMFETIIYVPWIAVIVGFVFYAYSRSRLILMTAAFSSLILLILLKLTNVDSRLENVQAVLDSQYWLIIHVLMIVGSYGAFILSGVLAHLYLIQRTRYKTENEKTKEIAKAILQTIFVGVALLIPGTILGGIWAAESWGRFWDWDPKESWAFISACIYLLIIHAYTFSYVRNFGLAVGAIIGLMTISFTWYGVNYILGTGLHSYGFGKGGEIYYYAYLIVEIAFIAVAVSMKKNIEHN